MKICNLASGSEGNVTYIETANHKILLDVGTTVNSNGKIVGYKQTGGIIKIGNSNLSTSTNLGTLANMPSVYEVVNGMNGVLNNGESSIWDDSNKSEPMLKWEIE